MSPTSFEIFGITGADLPHPGIALASARAGGIGVLDLEFVTDPEQARTNFARLLRSAQGRIGLRITAGQASLARSLLISAGERSITVILTGASSEIGRIRNASGVHSHHFCCAEIRSASDLEQIQSHCDALVVRGHEAGGWVGEDSSFILLQKLSGQVHKPLYVQGGAAVRGAAACRLAGAAGLVLDDAMLLMAESPLSVTLQQELARLNGAECRLFGEFHGAPCRAYARPGAQVLTDAENDSRALEGGQSTPLEWAERMHGRIGWQSSDQQLLPIGQSIGLAATYRDQYGNVGKLIQAVKRQSLRQMDLAAQSRFIDEGGALADSHRTRFPIAQGPMTRVSDHAGFAGEVAKAGGLPFLALALMRGPQVAKLLAETRVSIGDRPWGVGMLGFVPQTLRDEQCAEIWKCPPPFALIAGGRPDQAAEFEKRGITTYIHAPAPALLKMYLQQGARRFVFEGRECGGHVGPLSSFVLWEHMVETLLEQVPANKSKSIHVLFAGGIHDALSCAMLAALTAPLTARGMKVGVLMGTAYLFTREIVSSGAVVEGFQQEAMRCQHTVNLESGPGHASRCADTQFARDFYQTRRRLIREGKSSEEIRETLEDLNLGRLRVASKGVLRDDTGLMVDVHRDKQLSDGMYMLGQVATLRHSAMSVEALHSEVSRGAQALLETRVNQRMQRAQAAKPSDIAIVGIGVTLPKANDGDDYWEMILKKISAIREAPKDRWDADLYYDADPKAKDKIYSKWGGFLDEIAFDPTRFGIPPKSMKSIDPLQLLTLETAVKTLADAGYADGHFDRENTSVILGAGGGAGDLGVQYSMRSELPRFVANPTPDVWERLPEWTEESFAGTLLNVAAGRVANRLDLGGVNFTVDAACGSSLAAINIGVQELESGRSAMVLAGGFDTTQSVFAFTAFAKTQALSAKGEPRTFDQSADGIAISEGVAMVALKRLADAERDGDRIYGVIKATAGSSDGRALGLTAPRSEGQVRALHRAYDKAGFPAASLSLVEAHGTGTPVGDRTETQTIARALNDGGARPSSVSVGSVKTLLGHTKAAAGVAGLIKVTLALYHRVLPGHHGVSKPIETVADANSPVYLLKDARPWIAHPDHPRRGAASAFGFGGTNFHAVVEEYRKPASVPGASGSNRWPYELFLFRAKDDNALAQDLEKLVPHLQAASRIQTSALAAMLARAAEMNRGLPVCLAIVAGDRKGLAADLAATIAHLRGGNRPLPAHVRLNRNTPETSPQVAFLFPGQGAQYVNMGREAAIYLSEVREALEFADGVLRNEFPDQLSSLMYPPAAFDIPSEKAQLAALTDTRIAQPAIGSMSLGYLRFTERLGISAQATAGHSYGEYTALMAAGVIDAADFLRLSAVRGRAMADASKSTVPGAMAAVHGRRERVNALARALPGLRVANHNAPEQTVISGPREAVEAAARTLTEEGLRTTLLPVSGAFHTELVAPAKAPLSKAIHATRFRAPRAAVYSNTTASLYPNDPAAMQRQLDDHMLSGVEFVTEIETMYAAGARVFLELGPKGTCANLTRQTLSGRNATAISLDAGGGGLRGLLIGVSELLAAGVQLDVMALFADRQIPRITASELPVLGQPPEYPAHMWMVSGGCARPVNDPVLRTGAKPALTRATAEAARKAFDARLRAKPPAPSPTVDPLPAKGEPPQAPTMPAAASSAMGQDALIAYQQTMRQFLSLQERVIQQYMQGDRSAPAPAVPNVAAMPAVDSSPQVVTPAQAMTAPTAAVPVPKPATPTPARPASTASAVDAKQLLLDIVAERTGYPAQMLELDAPLEADLGIDSIKRVEILGALRNAMPDTVAEQMQAQMEQLTRAETLNAILALLPAPAQTSTPAPAQVSAEPPAASEAVAVAVDWKAELLKIVADRTGYPEEMLSVDADLEADLGIDSIKRVEIVGALRESVPEAAANKIADITENLTRASTLAAMIQQLPDIAQASPAATIPSPQAAPAPAAQPKPATRLPLDVLLRDIVAERTGYPQEMLATDADLEADLGIDSIKRVEILGALRQALPDDLSARVQARMESLSKARSLDALVAELNLVSGGIDDAQAPPDAPAPSAPADGIPAQDLESMVLELVSERTGYPTEMLDLNADLEADLGIDSIKRVEIIGGLREVLPEAQSEAAAQHMEQLSKAKSLSLLIQALAALGHGDSDQAAPLPDAARAAAEEEAQAGAAVEASDGIPRFVIKTTAAPLSQPRASVRGAALLLGRNPSTSKALAEQLELRGLQPVISDALDAPQLESIINQARTAHGGISAIAYLHGMDDAPASDLEQWRGSYQKTLMGLLAVLQSCGQDLAKVRLVAASRLGGTFGRDAVGQGAVSAGGLNGMLNCLRAEYSACVARAVDFADQSEAEIARLLADELLTDDPHPEAGYIGTERYGAITSAQTLNPNRFTAQAMPADDWVMLVTGGARGITAEIVLKMLRSEMNVLLLGRSPEPGAEDSETAVHPDAASLKRAILAAKIERGEKPRPVDMDHEVNRILVQREMRSNLARMRATGAKVQYLACDVRDANELGAAIDGLYAKHGRIDAVLHGAGVIEDKLIAEKQPDSFERVLGTKLDPAYVLAEKLRADSLKLLALFTSVAGRYGNRGQVDYAAANETLTRVAWDLHRRMPQARVMSVNWGPWDAGMASDEVKKALRARGMVPIPVAAGCQFFLDEIAYGPRNDVEIVAGQGPWADMAHEPIPANAAQTDSDHPLISDALRIGPGGAVSFSHQLTLSADPYLFDHPIDGKPVLPLSVAIEYVAEFVSSAWPGWQISQIREFRALRRFEVDAQNGAELLIRARAATHSEPGTQAVTVELMDAADKTHPVFRATTVLTADGAVATRPARLPLIQAGHALDGESIYSRFVARGPCFRGIGAIKAIDENGLEARIFASEPRKFLGAGAADRHWILDPMVLDSITQINFLWGQLHRGKGTVTRRIGQILRLDQTPLRGELRLVHQVRAGETDAVLRFDTEVFDADGNMRLAVLDGESMVSEALNRLAPSSPQFVASTLKRGQPS